LLLIPTAPKAAWAIDKGDYPARDCGEYDASPSTRPTTLSQKDEEGPFCRRNLSLIYGRNGNGGAVSGRCKILAGRRA